MVLSVDEAAFGSVAALRVVGTCPETTEESEDGLPGGTKDEWDVDDVVVKEGTFGKVGG